MTQALGKKKAALIIAFRDFRDEEYFIPKEILEKNGVETTTVSYSLGQALGVLGGEAEIDLLISDLKVRDFDAVVFVGGSGAAHYFQDPHAHRVALQTVLENKVLGAICIAPTILARSGALKGKKATVWFLNLDKSCVEILKKEGVVYCPESVVVDGHIVTAAGPEAAADFTLALLKLLTG